MDYRVRVVVRASRVRVEETGEGSLKVRLTQPASDGKANEQLCRVLADYWKIARSRIEIVRGAHGRAKTVRVHGTP